MPDFDIRVLKFLVSNQCTLDSTCLVNWDRGTYCSTKRTVRNTGVVEGCLVVEPLRLVKMSLKFVQTISHGKQSVNFHVWRYTPRSIRRTKRYDQAVQKSILPLSLTCREGNAKCRASKINIGGPSVAADSMTSSSAKVNILGVLEAAEERHQSLTRFLA